MGIDGSRGWISMGVEGSKERDGVINLDGRRSG